MNGLFRTILALAAAAVVALPTRPAEAQCAPGAVFCAHAEVHIGGSVHVGPPAPPPPRRSQVVVVHEPPPPPPPVVVYQPAPPPQTVVVAEARPVTAVQYDLEPAQAGFGLHGHLGGTFGPDVQVGGLTGAFRLRPHDGRFALDLGIGAYAGQDYNGWDRGEVPLTADLLLFVNPENRLQLYGLAGVGMSFAVAQDPWSGAEREFAYFGGEAGVGLEFRLSRWFALNGDVRGFIRSRIDADPQPEFVDEDGRTTNTSGGVLGTLGATVYF